MQTRLIFSDSILNTKIMQNLLKNKYNDLDDLSIDINRDKCQRPEKVDDYMIWKTINNYEKELESISEHNPELKPKIFLHFREEIIFTTSDLYSVLTPRRVEILEYIHKNNPKSVKSLAEEITRDYKNVYDDLKALEEFNLIEFVKEGKNKRPISRLTALELILDK